MTVTNDDTAITSLDAVSRLRDDVQTNMVRLRNEIDAALGVERTARATQAQTNRQFDDAIAEVRDIAANAAASAAEPHHVQFDDTALRAHVDQRISRVIDETNTSIVTQIASATRDIERRIKRDHAELEQAVRMVSTRLDEFDVQAARMVEYHSERTETLAERIADLANATAASAPASESSDHDAVPSAELDRIGQRLEAIEEHYASAFQNVIGRLDDLDRRLSEQINDAVRLSEERTGEQLASMDALLGRTGVGFDESMNAIANRIAALEARLDAD